MRFSDSLYKKIITNQLIQPICHYSNLPKGKLICIFNNLLPKARGWVYRCNKIT